MNNPEEAEVVKRIYREYLEGKSYYAIGQGLTADGIRTAAGSDYWLASTLKKILTKPDTRERIRCKLFGRDSEALKQRDSRAGGCIWMRKNTRTGWWSLIISWLLLRKIS